jgi:hypothetical protein
MASATDTQGSSRQSCFQKGWGLGWVLGKGQESRGGGRKVTQEWEQHEALEQTPPEQRTLGWE